MTTATNYDERAKTFLMAERPRGFTQLHRNNQVGIIQLINDVLLEWQERGLHGKIVLEVGVGTKMTDIKPRPNLKVVISD